MEEMMVMTSAKYYARNQPGSLKLTIFKWSGARMYIVTAQLAHCSSTIPGITSPIPQTKYPRLIAKSKIIVISTPIQKKDPPTWTNFLKDS
jgi:hypothetical protein